MIAAGIEDVNHELIGGIDESLLFGESFEEPAGPSGVSGDANRITWSPFPSSARSCGFAVVVGDAQTGLQSQLVNSSGVDSCGVLNAGLDSAGLAFFEGKVYVGYIYAKNVGSAGGLAVNVSLVDTSSGFSSVLASVSLPLTASTEWTRLEFSLIPRAGTTCWNDATPRVPCQSTPEGLCITCGGAFFVSLPPSLTPISVLFDEAVLAPGPWGATLSSRIDIARALTGLTGTESGAKSTGLGLTAIRLGGSMILADGYKWKAFRGPRWLRDPYAGFWYPFTSTGVRRGAELTAERSPAPSALHSQWGMFEFLALCDAAKIELCVVTMNSGEVSSYQ